MDSLEIKGGNKIAGEITISGSKNAALPIVTSTILSKKTVTIYNIPDVADIKTLIKLLKMLGAKEEFNSNTLKIDTNKINNTVATYDIVRTMRASILVLGPLLARFGYCEVSLPGGCAWGPRPVDYHLKGFEKLGAEIVLEDGYIIARAKKLKGARIHFEIPSVGATGNIVMAAVLAEGITRITNAAMEPHIVQVCEVLNEMGAQIEGVGTSILKIHGVGSLNPVEVTTIPDMIEAGTFLMAGATLGNITLNNVKAAHLSIVMQKLEQAGCRIHVDGNSISIEKCDRLEAVDMTTDVYPGFPTDLQAQWIALMSVAKGSSIITDTIYHDRFSHVPELVRLGANISLENNVVVVRGVEKLKGAQVMSTDIRASASLVIAALMAEGRTDISRIYHIDRGYERIEKKFQSLGADICRETE